MLRAPVAALFLAGASVLPPAGCAPSERPAVRVAVTASFARTHEVLARRFTAHTGTPVRASVGSTGQLYAQIRNGAPFDVFLAADAERPRLLEQEGRAHPGSRWAYARGRLALVSAPGGAPLPGRLGRAALLDPGVHGVALANPRTAPYGAAAVETLEALGLFERLEARLVPGENVSQAWQFVASGAAELGFVALSQVHGLPAERVWVVPDSLHAPLLHEAVLLSGSGGTPHEGREGSPAAVGRAYLAFLRGAEAGRIIEAAGYGVGEGAGAGRREGDGRGTVVDGGRP